MRPYHIRRLIVVASISATITVLMLNVLGYLLLPTTVASKSNDLKFTSISVGIGSSSSLPSGQSDTTLRCLNGFAMLKTKQSTHHSLILADKNGVAIKCQP
ncbi:MAG: hypothetical protein ACJA0M_000451 [Chitinophagales bacterium]|jgi:hypothetical protein